MTKRIAFFFVASVLTLSSVWLPAANAQQIADLAVTKSGPDQAAAGSDVTYTIHLFNLGPDNSVTATLVDSLPAGTTFVSLANPVSWSCVTPSVGSGGNITCTNPSVLLNSDDVFTLVVHFDPNAAPGTTFTNTVSVSTPPDPENGDTDPNSENNTAFASTTVPGGSTASADLGVIKTADRDEAFANSDITYTIQVTNAGPNNADNATLDDTLPVSVTFVSLASPAGWSCTTPNVGSGGTISCSNPSLAVNSTSVFTLVGHIQSGTSAGTQVFNRATATSTTADSNPDNNSGDALVTVVTCFSNAVVTTNADSGPGSLRQAIADVCSGGSIVFDTSKVVSPITLTTDELLISKDLTISGPGANVLAVTRSAAGGTPEFRIFEVAGGANVTISGLTISNGAPTPGNTNAAVGGGIFNSGTLAIDGVVVSGNRTGSPTAAGPGGGLFNFGTLTVTNSTFSGNQGNTGGGLQSNGSAVTIINSTISGNIAATTVGGGITLASGTLTITNSTISNNRSDFDNAGGDTGGGIYQSPTAGLALLNNTIVAGNFRGTGTTRDDLNGVFSTSSSNNLIGDGTGETGITNGTNGNKVGTSANPINALLAALGNYGGPTPTHLLLPGSPAIDAGSNALANDSAGAPLTTDQRGFARVVNSTVDIGAVEVNYAITATSGTPQSTQVNTAFPAALVATVTESGNPVGGVSVTFTPPASGPSGTFAGGTPATVTTNSGGAATAPTFTANAIAGGPYTVKATVASLSASADFSLTNTPAAATPTPTPTPTPTQALNIATRARVDIGDKVMIGGFIITGNASKAVVVRGLGPSLANFGVPAATVLNDPLLELRGSNGALLMMNDNWKESPQRSQIEGTNFQPTDDREAVILATLAPGNYTAILRGARNTTGVGLVEVYDTNPAADSALANISTRGSVETGNNVMIGGFTLGGNSTPSRIAVRALGPSLSSSGLSPVLADPTLALRNANGTLMISNDDWQSDSVSAGQLSANGLGLPNPKESGIFTTLPPGQFTVIVASKNGGTGIGLVEIYNVK